MSSFVRAVVGVLSVLGIVAGIGWAVHAQGQTYSGAEGPTAFTATTSPVESAAPTSMLWVGDSYVQGTGATTQEKDYASRVCAHFGWVCKLDAEGGTGFVADGHANSQEFEPAIQRLPEDVQRYDPDVVIIDLGRNDGDWSPVVSKAAAKYVAAVRRVFPNAKLVMVTPFLIADSHPVPKEWLSEEHRLMKKYDGSVIDTSAWGSASLRRMTIPDGVHPNDAGYRYLAGRFETAFKSLGYR